MQSVLLVAAALTQISSAFVISKSSNKNEVSYAVDVDGSCAPAGAAPVHPYWRMLERGANAIEPLTAREERAFGVASQSASGDLVRFVVRGLHARPITLRTFRGTDGRCAAAPQMTIAGAEARIESVFVKLSLFGVSYVQLTGLAPSGATVSERISP